MKELKFPSELNVGSLDIERIFEFPTYKDGDNKPRGAEGRLLEVLSQALHFRYNLIIPEDKQWGSESKNGTWSGLIGLVSSGKADVALCFIGASNDRKRVVDFTESYTSNDLTFATHFPRMLHRAYVYMYPFDIATWLGILTVLLFMPFMFRLLGTTQSSYSYLVMKLLGTIFNQAVEKERFNNLILLGSWWYFASLISAGYAAVLASFLTIPMYSTHVRDFKELSKAVKHEEYKVFAPKGTAIIPVLRSNGKEYMNFIADQVEKNDWFVTSDKYMNEDNFQEKTALLGVTLMLNFRFGREPLATKFLSQDVCLKLPVVMVVNKNFCCKSMIDTAIKKINHAGLYKRIVDDELYKAWFRATKEDSDLEAYHALTIDDISGALILLLAGYCLSLNVFIAEIVYSHFFKMYFVV
ncbi:glutamate receptor ionotropic, delta-1 [Trichonephila clavata]|uniref:Glutamate receptor ionotropic, delta-1 n=1 Tax=Trichonephila clavata TaxID=2740835 RepID=A0A8X6KJ90_TRICU|nr:glutamate receptor ionotropic, delta-1 [Trichonephila clavata]